MTVSTQLREAKHRAAEAIRAAEPQLRALSDAIHSNPEVSFEEVTAARLVAEAVAAAGYEVCRPVEELPTAVAGTLRGTAGVGQTATVAVLAEYDALPGLGHGCGHNLMAAAGVGAALGLAATRDAFGGEVRFLGAPAEERGAGKEVMIQHGLLDGVSAALLFHPNERSHLASPALALEELTVEFTGRAAHASGAPWEGVNALDAMVQLFVSVGLWRQQLPTGTRVHGIITNGGEAPNIIPAATAGSFMIRAADEKVFATMRGRFRELARTAAEAHGCDVVVVSQGASRTMRDNGVLLEAFRDNASHLGLRFGKAPDSCGSTDMGNVSHVVAAIQPNLQVCDEGTPLHSEEFCARAAGDRANAVALQAAITLAHTALDVLLDAPLRGRAHAEFAGLPMNDIEPAKGAPGMDLTQFEALSFDCYGTLIDWEAGIASVLVPWAQSQSLSVSEEELLTTYARHEARVLRDNPTMLYPRATAEAFAAVGKELGAPVPSEDQATIAESVPHWPAFPDSAAALQQLAQHYKLIILSNVDDASFREANRKLGVEFSAINTAEAIGSYKPNPANFDALLASTRDQGVTTDKLLHVAQSLFHDHVPAKDAGLCSVWIDRRHDKPGWGATPPPPSQVQPDERYTSMAEFAAACQQAFEEVA